MSEDTATTTTIETETETKAKRGRKAGTVNIPESAVRAYVIRTMEGMGKLPAPVLYSAVRSMAPTIRNSQEFRDSQEYKNIRLFKVTESVAKWDSETRDDYIRAILATSDARERALVSELLAGFGKRVPTPAAK